MSGDKTDEIRGVCYKSLIGKRIWLCESGSKGIVKGKAVVHAIVGPLSVADWEETRASHCVPAPAPRLYGEHTFAYVLRQVTCVEAFSICRKVGSVFLQKGSGW